MQYSKLDKNYIIFQFTYAIKLDISYKTFGYFS